MSSYLGPALTTPSAGRAITPAGELAYRKRSSAEQQARAWNELLRLDPVHGPESGLRVGVAPLPSQQSDGLRWELVWTPCEGGWGVG